MVKSGSLWYYRMTDDLIMSSGNKHNALSPPHPPINNLRKGDKIKCDKLNFSNLISITSSLKKGYRYPIKTHSRPTIPLALFQLTFKNLKITYTYRDPRDVVLSVMDHAEKARRDDININIRDIRKIDEAIDFVKVEFKKWKKWDMYSKIFNVEMVRYEDMVKNTAQELKKLRQHLQIQVTDDKIKEIVNKYRKDKYDKRERIRNNTHMNKGYSGRFLKEMDKEDIEYCQNRMIKEIKQMGYPIIDAKNINTYE